MPSGLASLNPSTADIVAVALMQEQDVSGHMRPVGLEAFGLDIVPLEGLKVSTLKRKLLCKKV